MADRPISSVRDDELHALLDEHLDTAARAALQQRLDQDPAARATLAAWQRQRQALRGLYQSLLHESPPAPMLATALRLQRAHQHVQQLWRLGGVAAGLLLAFGLGWFAHGQLQPAHGPLALAQPVSTFVQQATVAHVVFAPEVRHPVEVAATQEEHLIQWLSKRLGRTLKAPRLHEQGFELVGGRLLPGDDGARAQLMYQNAQGQRVTLYLGSLPADAGLSAAHTEFRYTSEGPVPSFYWVDQGFAYALSGPLSRQTLLLLAQQVHQQL
jgi:anti-sigma factor RsiW